MHIYSTRIIIVCCHQGVRYPHVHHTAPEDRHDCGSGGRLRGRPGQGALTDTDAEVSVS